MRIITTHKNTDFDALASTFAAAILLPDAIPVIPKSINPNVKAFLSIHKDVFKTYSPAEIDNDQVTTLIVVDTNKWDRLDGFDQLKKKKDLEVILWDHHPDNGDIEATSKCQEEMGATVTLMVRNLIKEKKIITPVQATLFLAGLYEDTGHLTFSATKAEDAMAAAYLLERKADLGIISTILRPAYGERQKDILFQMLQAPKRTKVNGYSISFGKLDIEGHVDSLAVVVGMYREILNVDAAFGVFGIKDQGKCIVIGRSNIDMINIGTVMQRMGGGGHPAAGSVLLNETDKDAVEKNITDFIKRGQLSAPQVSDLMSFPVVTIAADAKMKIVAMLLREKGCTGVPVIEDDKLVGIISRRDFRKIKKESQLESPVKAFMSTNVISIEPGISPIQAVRLMVKYDIGRIPVVDNGHIIGIITRSDVMLYFYDTLPN